MLAAASILIFLALLVTRWSVPRWGVVVLGRLAAVELDRLGQVHWMEFDENISGSHGKRQGSCETLLGRDFNGKITDLLPQAEVGFHLGKVHGILLYAVDVKGYLCDCLVALRFVDVERDAFELACVFEAINGGRVRVFLLGSQVFQVGGTVGRRHCLEAL